MFAIVQTAVDETVVVTGLALAIAALTAIDRHDRRALNARPTREDVRRRRAT